VLSVADVLKIVRIMLGKELNRAIRYLTEQNAKTATDVSTIVQQRHYH
jgi:hypothetical protein